MTDASDKSSGNSIVADHLVKKFGELVAVNDISFTVGERELFGLLGPNGAGKTTLIRMLTTLTPPTSGTARIAGHDIVTDAVPIEFEAAVRHAEASCPEAAIIVTDGLSSPSNGKSPS